MIKNSGSRELAGRLVAKCSFQGFASCVNVIEENEFVSESS